MTTATLYRISRHENFPCRYTSLPKAVRGLSDNPKLFSDEDEAMVELGLGKKYGGGWLEAPLISCLPP